MSQSLKQLNQKRYGQVAEKYVASTPHATGMWLDDFIALADAKPHWRVLDVATGGGHTALSIASHVNQVVAVDLTPNMLQAAGDFFDHNDASHIMLSAADAEVLPFADETFDCVLCRVAAHHFPDIFAFMLQAWRVLRPDGVLMLHDHVMPEDDKINRYVNAYEKLRDPSHARALSEFEWRGTFLDAGFKMTFVEQRTIEHNIISWAKRQNCTDETIERLQIMLHRAPQKVLDWMQPQHIGTPQAQYTDHHIIVRGQKVTYG